MALNAKTEEVALNAKWKTNNGFERQTKDVSRYRNECVALNIEHKMNDGSERRTERMALNAKLKVIAMNAKQQQRL